MKPTKQQRWKESGNVLFLILIAVALFAALSYAVTQSTRSGGGDASSETNQISGAQLTQYPAGIRTSIVRMIVGGTDISTLEFNAPSDFGLGAFTPTAGVFHPSGGGATFVVPPADLIAVTEAGNGIWHFNNQFDIPNIGTDGNAGKELIAFLPGVSGGVCTRINTELGIAGIPSFGADVESDYEQTIQDDASTIAGVNQVAWSSDTTAPADTFPVALAGQPFGCFVNDTNVENVYYHVLVER